MSRSFLRDCVLIAFCLMAVMVVVATDNARTEWFREWLEEREKEVGR